MSLSKGSAPFVACGRGTIGKIVVGLLLAMAGGCVTGPHVLSIDQQKTVDRRITEYPTGFELKPFVTNLTGPTAETLDDDGNLIIAEGGIDGREPHIFGIKLNDPGFKQFDIYPVEHRIPFLKPGFHIYGPIGGIVAYHGKIYVAHRDHLDWGVITAFGYDGSHTTIVGGLPARGDYGVTSLAVSRLKNKLYFGVGTATNSGVVGLDNWQADWVRDYPDFCDRLYKDTETTGFRFDAPNPEANVFTSSITVTGPFQPFGISNITHILAAPFGRPSGAIYSIAPEGGEPTVEAWGVHNPVGIVENEFGWIYFTDRGMELRGTRPIADDPDGLFRLVSDSNYGWPDFSRSLESVREQKFQPPPWMLSLTGYGAVAPLIDRGASGLADPDRRLISGQFPSLAGASKMDLAPQTTPYRDFRRNLIVALWGNSAPFATNGRPLRNPPPGFSVVRVDPDTHEVHNFIFNTEGGPASALHEGRDEAIERPIDVKFGPDGILYVLDFGRMEMKDGHMQITPGTGKVFRLMPTVHATTAPTTRP